MKVVFGRIQNPLNCVNISNSVDFSVRCSCHLSKILVNIGSRYVMHTVHTLCAILIAFPNQKRYLLRVIFTLEIKS